MDSWFGTTWLSSPTAVVKMIQLKITQKQFFIGEHEDQGRQWVVPLNSNWSGIPDTLETKRLKFQVMLPLLLQIVNRFVSLRKIQPTTLPITKGELFGCDCRQHGFLG